MAEEEHGLSRKTLIIGAAVIDQMMRIDRLPKSGEDIPCLASTISVGGCAFNVASTMRNLGADHDLLVPVGNGLYAGMIRQSLAKNGYPVLLENKALDNGYCLSLVDRSGERTFITVTGAEEHFKKEWLDGIDLRKYGQVYLDGYLLSGSSGKTVAGWLSQKMTGPTLFFAPGPVISRIPKAVMEAVFALHPVLHMNEKEALDFTTAASAEEAARLLFRRTDAPVVVTLGEKGAAFFDGVSVQIIPTLPVKAVDTTGAGDSHIGTILSDRARNLSFPEAIAHANRVAAAISSTWGSTMTAEEFAAYRV